MKEPSGRNKAIAMSLSDHSDHSDDSLLSDMEKQLDLELTNYDSLVKLTDCSVDTLVQATASDSSKDQDPDISRLGGEPRGASEIGTITVGPDKPHLRRVDQVANRIPELQPDEESGLAPDDPSCSKHLPGAFRISGSRSQAVEECVEEDHPQEQDVGLVEVEASLVDPKAEAARIAQVRQEARREGEQDLLERAASVRGTPVPVKRNRRILIAISLPILAGVGIFGGITLNNDKSGQATYPANVIAAINIIESEDSTVLSAYATVTTELVNGVTPITTGIAGEVECKPKVCQDDRNCKLGGIYEHGCCVGTDPNCAEEDKCGEVCDITFSDPICSKIDPSDLDCTNKDCYKCETGSQGEEIYTLREFVVDIDCLDVGETFDETDGVSFRWAVICGAVVSGAQPNRNYGIGEYACIAFDGHHQRIASFLPCQFIQLGECKCAPEDVVLYGLDPPKQACATEEDCPFLCGDAGKDKVVSLCRAFGGLDWWYGNNFVDWDLFDAEGRVASQFEIYIKELDNPVG